MKEISVPEIQLNDNKALSVLLNVSKNVLGTFDLQKILQETVNGASALFDWGTAAVYLLEGQDHIRLSATYPELPPDFSEELRYFELEEHPHLAESIRSAQPVIVEDTEKTALSDGERLVVEQRRLRTLYFVPLVSENDVLGAFIVGSSNQTSPVTDEKAKFTSSLANFAALAIKNARLFEEKTKYTKELERTITQRDEAEAKQKQLQEDLFQVQKLDAIGKLAGGVAHDFNNQLSGILGYAELLHAKLNDEDLSKYASQIVALAKHSAELNSRLLIFSRKSQLRKIPVNLNRTINEVADLLHHTISPQIEIFLSLNATLDQTIGDPAQIQSALLNLAINARDAMPKGGRIYLESHDSPWLQKEMRIGPFLLSPGSYVRITVRDSGVGMNSETIERLYEPFFTTKAVGEGTGLGLAAVFGTIKSHGGAIEVESRLGEGAKFDLFFPLANSPVLTETADDSADYIICDNQEVLVIDDKDFNVDIICSHLNEAGYVTHGFTSAIEAIDFFRQEYRNISLILLDMLMPKKNVTDIFRDLKEVNPDVSLILMSGSANKEEVQSLLDEGAGAFLQKPFYRKELFHVLKKFPGK